MLRLTPARNKFRQEVKEIKVNTLNQGFSLEFVLSFKMTFDTEVPLDVTNANNL